MPSVAACHCSYYNRRSINQSSFISGMTERWPRMYNRHNIHNNTSRVTCLIFVFVWRWLLLSFTWQINSLSLSLSNGTWAHDTLFIAVNGWIRLATCKWNSRDPSCHNSPDTVRSYCWWWWWLPCECVSIASHRVPRHFPLNKEHLPNTSVATWTVHARESQL